MSHKLMINSSIWEYVKRNYRSLLNIISYLVIVASIIFLAHKFWHIRSEIAYQEISDQSFLRLAVCTIFYTVNGSFMIYAWYRLLMFWGQKNLVFKDCYSAYAKSQIARYIPGNIFHIPVRHVAGLNQGYGNKPLAAAAIYEIIGIASSSSILALLASLFLNVRYRTVPYTAIIILSAVAFASPLFIDRLLKYYPAIKADYIPERTNIQILKGLLPIFLSYCSFFLILSGLFLYVVYSVCGYDDYTQIGMIFTVFLLAVIAGFLTPGAPGGLGVREAVIVFLLSDHLGQAVILSAALLFRIVTISGDLLLFLSPTIIDRFAKTKKV